MPIDRLVVRLVLAMVPILVLAGMAQPGAGTIATLIPLAVALPYLDRRMLGRLTLFVVALAAFQAVGADLIPQTSTIPADIRGVLHVSGVIIAFGIVCLLVSQFADRLRTTGNELASVVALSNELAQTLDPREIGDLTARHVAETIGADECGICYWDDSGERVLTFGYYPPERRSAVDDAYDLADYPLSRRVLESQVAVTVSDDDPAADPAETAYLRSIGQRSMAIVPLVAKGRSLGAIEATSARPGFFDPRRIRLARTLAAEAGIALENARLYDELRHQAFHDGLTGLANRTLFRDRVEHAVARRPGAASGTVAVLFLDLDDFKTINESLGHHGGDELLAAVGERIRACLRPADTAARLGGDEFAILLEDLDDETEAMNVAQRLLDSLRSPIRIGETAATIAASIGIALTSAGGDDVGELLRNADFAMYQAKRGGKNRYEVFRAALREAATERARLEALLRGAEARDELRIHYQPIVDLANGAIVGVEALVRWQPAGRGLLMPVDFIGLAEDSGLIVQIGRWVLDRACRQTQAWRERYDLDGLSVSVNLSARQFQHPDLIAEVGAALAASDLEPSRLVLEITESVLMQTTAATIGKLADLRRLGVRLAIDDFGTGYSSLGYLERFPVDILKIDKTFIDGIGEPGGRPVLARAILQLGRALGLQVVAEGVERREQVVALRRLGCTRAQGHLFARPLPAEAVEPLLRAGRVDAVVPGWEQASAGPIPIRPVAGRRLRATRGRRPVVPDCPASGRRWEWMLTMIAIEDAVTRLDGAAAGFGALLPAVEAGHPWPLHDVAHDAGPESAWGPDRGPRPCRRDAPVLARRDRADRRRPDGARPVRSDDRRPGPDRDDRP